MLYLANIIDYFRVYFLYLAFQEFQKDNGYMFVGFYLFSYFLDALDGMAARALNQTSKLGLYLDMIIDRVSSSLCLYVAAHKITALLPGDIGIAIAIVFYFNLAFVEVLAHGVVMYKSEIGGFHQKEMQSHNPVVRLYLDDKRALFFGCACFEAVPCAVMVGQPIWAIPFIPGFLFRSIANLLRLRDIITFTDDGSKAK